MICALRASGLQPTSMGEDDGPSDPQLVVGNVSSFRQAMAATKTDKICVAICWWSVAATESEASFAAHNFVSNSYAAGFCDTAAAFIHTATKICPKRFADATCS